VACSKCNSTAQFEVTGCNATHNRACQEYRECDFDLEYIAVNETTSSDRLCQLVTACREGFEREVHPPTRYQDRVCTGAPKLNQSLVLGAQVVGSGASFGGLVATAVEQVTTYVYRIAGAAGRQGSFTVSLGQALSDTVSVSAPRRAAATVEAVTSPDDAVYGDRPLVLVTVQVRDSVGQASVLAGTAVQAELRVGSSFRAADRRAVTGQCTVASSTGQCQISLTLRGEWRTEPTGVGPTGDAETVEVHVGLGVGGSMALVRSLPVIRTGVPAVVDHLFASLPQKPLFPGESADVVIYGLTSTYGIGSYRVKLSLNSSALSIVSGSVDTARWTGANTGGGSDSIAFAYALKVGVTASGSGQPVELARVAVRALASVAGSVAVEAQLTINELRDSSAATRLPGGATAFPVPGFVFGRHGLAAQGIVVEVTEDVVVGLLGRLTEAELVNTASLTGTAMASSALSFSTVHRSGAIRGVTSPSSNTALTCQISGATQGSVAALVGRCGGLSLGPEDVAPGSSDRLAVLATHGASGATVAVPFVVTAPTFPVRLALAQAELKAVRGWRGTGTSCLEQGYQATAVQVYATFVGNGATFTGEVTGLLQSGQVRVSDAAVAAVLARQPGEGGALRVRGLGLGAANVTIWRGTTQLSGQAGLRVLPAAVEVLEVQAFAVSEVQASLELPSGPSPGLGEALRLRVQAVEPALKVEGAATRLVASAVYSDGVREPLTGTMGVTYESVAPEQVSVLGDVAAVAVGATSGSGDYVRAVWGSRSGNGSLCFGQAVARASVPLTVDLPLPTRVRVTGVPARLAVSGSPAALAGVGVQVAIAVVLDFESGPSRVMTADARTIFDTSQSQDTFRVVQQGSAVLLEALRVGGGELRVTFSNPAYRNITAAVAIRVVSAADLRISSHPSPSYPGSTAVGVSVLARFDGSNPTSYQSAVLSTTMVLSDGFTIALSASQVAYVAQDGPNATRSAAEVVTVSGDRVTGRQAGQVTVASRFEGYTGTSTLLLTVSDAGVRVDRIEVTSVVAGPASTVLGVGTLLTLTGIKDAGTAFMRVRAVFSDGREIVDMAPSGAGPVVPGLLRFSSSNPDAVGVDAVRGEARLFLNGVADLSVRVNASGASPEASQTLTGNLAPALGDVDLGGEVGYPIPSARVGDVVQVAVAVNTGGTATAVGAFTFVLQIDPSVVRLSRAVAAYANGFLESNQDGAEIIITGTVQSAMGGTRAVLVNVYLEVLGEGRFVLTGSIATLKDQSTPAVAIGTRQGQAFEAGTAVLEALAAGRRRRTSGVSIDGRPLEDVPIGAGWQVSAAAVAEAQRRAAALQGPGSASLAGLRRGREAPGCHPQDVDGNCEFDAADASFVFIYLAELDDGFRQPQGQQVRAILDADVQREANLDADRNGKRDTLDGIFLLEVVARKRYFVGKLGWSASRSGAECLVSFSVPVYSQSLAPAREGDTLLFLDVAGLGTAFQEAAREYVSTAQGAGAVVYLRAGLQSSSVTARAMPVNGSLVFQTSLPTRLLNSSAGGVGLSLVLVVRLSDAGRTVEQRFLGGVDGGVSMLYSDEYQVTVAGFEGRALTLRETNVTAGYNPRQVVAVGQALSVAGCVLNCELDEYEDVAGGACVPVQRCLSNETESAPPTPTSDRTCVPTTTTTTSTSALLTTSSDILDYDESIDVGLDPSGSPAWEAIAVLSVFFAVVAAWSVVRHEGSLLGQTTALVHIAGNGVIVAIALVFSNRVASFFTHAGSDSCTAMGLIYYTSNLSIAL
jgi:hypothetical protein